MIPVKPAALAILYHAMLVPVVSEAVGVIEVNVICTMQTYIWGSTTVCMTSYDLRPQN